MYFLFCLRFKQAEGIYINKLLIKSIYDFKLTNRQFYFISTIMICVYISCKQKKKKILINTYISYGNKI